MGLGSRQMVTMGLEGGVILFVLFVVCFLFFNIRFVSINQALLEFEAKEKVKKKAIRNPTSEAKTQDISSFCFRRWATCFS